MNDSPPKQPRRCIGQKILLGLFCLALLAFFAVLVLNMVAKNSLIRYERQWEAKGEHFDFASFIPKPVPDDQNFALTSIVASSYEGRLDKPDYDSDLPNTNFVDRLRMTILVRESDWEVLTNNGNWAKGTGTGLKAYQLYYRTFAGRTNGFPVASQMQSPAADVLLALSKYDSTIEELRLVAALPDSRFPLKYDSEFPATISLPHLSALKSCCQVLQLRAVAELQNGQSDKALADVKLMLRLVDSVRTEPFLITHLVRISMLNLSLQPVWEGLQDHRWSDAQLVELNHELAKLDFLADYEFSMRGERITSMRNIEYLRRTRNFNGVIMEGGLSGRENDAIPGVVKVACHFIPNSVFYQNELAIARAHQERLLTIVDVEKHSASPATAALTATNFDKEFMHWSPNSILARMMLPALVRSSQRFAYAQSAVDMARVACALERFRLAQGGYPETLDALQPRFIESVPHDVIGGQPLKYHRMDNGLFALYSVGWNEMDDGGKVVLRKPGNFSVDYEKGDWVWSGQVMGSE